MPRVPRASSIADFINSFKSKNPELATEAPDVRAQLLDAYEGLLAKLGKPDPSQALPDTTTARGVPVEPMDVLGKAPEVLEQGALPIVAPSLQRTARRVKNFGTGVAEEAMDEQLFGILQGLIRYNPERAAQATQEAVQKGRPIQGDLTPSRYAYMRGQGRAKNVIRKEVQQGILQGRTPKTPVLGREVERAEARFGKESDPAQLAELQRQRNLMGRVGQNLERQALPEELSATLEHRGVQDAPSFAGAYNEWEPYQVWKRQQDLEAMAGGPAVDEKKRYIMRLLQRTNIPETEKAILAMVLMRNAPLPEIGSALGLSKGTISSRMTEFVNNLQQRGGLTGDLPADTAMLQRVSPISDQARRMLARRGGNEEAARRAFEALIPSESPKTNPMGQFELRVPPNPPTPGLRGSMVPSKPQVPGRSEALAEHVAGLIENMVRGVGSAEQFDPKAILSALRNTYKDPGGFKAARFSERFVPGRGVEQTSQPTQAGGHMDLGRLFPLGGRKPTEVRGRAVQLGSPEAENMKKRWTSEHETGWGSQSPLGSDTLEAFKKWELEKGYTPRPGMGTEPPIRPGDRKPAKPEDFESDALTRSQIAASRAEAREKARLENIQRMAREPGVRYVDAKEKKAAGVTKPKSGSRPTRRPPARPDYRDRR